MRQLRELPDQDSAVALCDALIASGIEIRLMENARGTFDVWVVDEAQMARAQELTRSWLEGGSVEPFEAARNKGRTTRELAMRIEMRRNQQRQAVAQRMAELIRPRATPLTWGIIALCIGVFVAIWLLKDVNDEGAMISMLTIVDARLPVAKHSFALFGVQVTWAELSGAQPWRVLTPVLIHANVLHIAFNLLWMRDLGRVIEVVHGTRYLAAFVALSAALSNIMQFEITLNPLFGGLSGVVYGLLGLIWLRGRIDPQVGYRLPKATTQLMLFMLALGFIPGIRIASWAHLGGLLTGLLWALVASKLSRRTA